MSFKEIIKVLGEIENKTYGYFITDRCTGCGACYSKCPQKCIKSGVPSIIKQENCLHCGNCMSICPFNAVEKKEVKISKLS